MRYMLWHRCTVTPTRSISIAVRLVGATSQSQRAWHAGGWLRHLPKLTTPLGVSEVEAPGPGLPARWDLPQWPSSWPKAGLRMLAGDMPGDMPGDKPAAPGKGLPRLLTANWLPRGPLVT
jgi:hypothetical protein